MVAIIALLLAVLLPSLSRARDQAKLAVCGSHLRQLAIAVATYSEDQGSIPYGPAVEALDQSLEANDGHLATNQFWTGPQQPTNTLMAQGLLLNVDLVEPSIFFCPGDDSTGPVTELAKIRHRQPAPAFGSYLYRQLDETSGQSRLESLGRNGAGRPVMTLALDVNSLITLSPGLVRTNHQGRKVNIAYLNGAVFTVNNDDHHLSLSDQDLFDLAGRRDEILQQADAYYWTNLSNQRTVR